MTYESIYKKRFVEQRSKQVLKCKSPTLDFDPDKFLIFKDFELYEYRFPLHLKIQEQWNVYFLRRNEKYAYYLSKCELV